MNRNSAFKSRPRGFTLVELLVVITIIAILASITLAGLQAARRVARESKSRGTIAKLHNIIMRKYESYSYRRVPLSDNAIYMIATSSDPAVHRIFDPAGQFPVVIQQTLVPTATRSSIRLAALRDVMRMEMPERLNDVVDEPVFPSVMSRPSLSRKYKEKYDLAKARTTAASKYGPGDNRGEGMERLGRYGSAECLYMVVMLSDAESRSQFSDSEIGDVDDDGLPEFLDGWGNPIKFLRWAPGFNESEIQMAPSNPNDLNDLQFVAGRDHDPLDTSSVDKYAWRLIPLIYSAGADGIYDIHPGGGTFHYGGNPYMYWDTTSNALTPALFGAPQDNLNISVTNPDPPDSPDPNAGPRTTPTSLDHYDNIHNHNLEAR